MANKYHQFFVESPEGERFMAALREMIDAQHEAAEKDPDQAVAFTQRACGIRNVMLMINSMSTDSKKGKTVVTDVES